QIALRLLAAPGTLVLAGRRQHVVAYENGAGARNAGVQFSTLDDEHGTLAASAIAWAVEATGHHMPTVGAVCIENTHMPANGAPWPMVDLEAVAKVCRAAGVPVHMDGARLFNAAVATGCSAAELAAHADTVMCCLSKGLGAPVGSLLAGPAELITEARAIRSGLGGGMRQAGVLAAAGIVSLEEMVERLADDHARARRLAEAVQERWPGAGVEPAEVRTNIVTFNHEDPARLLGHLRDNGVRAGTIAPGVVRLVTHHDVDDVGVERALMALAASP
ncbi:MAG TPA: GntG family PLP-dependent aldolase, partial [Acidimicrobiales bacterium]|nr:GntG family PLP-dependent aldolase [Acidimicrobiales bacterium]